ncbi:hypothetical protein Back11_09980 [Paenibacillus baekrokdamisoli]|uniref:Uncharacterized protein n=1 Tax=Paenibacillus baekrokdamisoli TaxID=1712516 RepID=A0A3G9J4J6_9BACL|nr:hypothetical protein [Paenibacillus baekrokdamisoli]MBB3067155.1 signal transduction histidine kinase [Paenibacillus baekrokdamisoli]BBH19653.1 hypothetical protein Back11_09980 [Paenibacillus baekrokdamisoli]
MGERVKTIFLLLLYSLICGLLLSIFPVIASPIRYVFSLLALVLGIYSFRRFESIRSRILLCVLAIVFFILFTFIIAAVTYLKTNPPT